jgi:hypothetical protein
MTPGTPSQDPPTELDQAPESASTKPPPRGAVAAKGSSIGATGAGEAKAEGYVTAGHDVLFEPATPTCDVCDGPLTSPDDDAAGEDDGGGRGLYIWVRSGGLVYEEPPLCPACAAAITISALQRWDIEEEEG